MRWRRGIKVGAGASLAATLGVTAGAQAATFEVDNLADPSGAGSCTAADTDCSLRQAIENASLNAGDDNVVFKSGLSGQITLGSPGIQVPAMAFPDRVTITGPGARALSVTGPIGDTAMAFYSSATVTGLTVSGDGEAGGAMLIRSQGDLNLNGVALTNSHAKYGGGVAIGTGTTATIANSTISGNAADRESFVPTAEGGGVYIGGGTTVRIANSTIAGNSSAFGGGVSIRSSGPSHVAIVDSTISGNVATARDFDGPDPDPPEGGTGGGIYSGPNADLKLYNSIVANNTVTPVSGAPSEPDVHGALIAQNSLIENPAGAAATTPAGSRLLVGVDPLLGPLQNNGGQTDTLRPDPKSVVVDGGVSTLTSDQRAGVRPVDIPSVPNPLVTGANGADIGAVELTLDEACGPLPEQTKKKKRKKHGRKGKKKALLSLAATAKKKHKKNGTSAAAKCRKKPTKKKQKKHHKHKK